MDSIVKRLHEKRRIETAKSILESQGYEVSEAAVYNPYDQSDRDNSDYFDEKRKEEESHDYVGKKVRWSENGRVYTVTRAYDTRKGVTVRCGDITMNPEEYKLVESAEDDLIAAEYACKSIVVDNQGVMEIVCYDTVEDEEFTKYIGQVESPTARKNARLILKDPKFEVPKNISNELIGTFGLEEFGYSISESEDLDEDKAMEFSTEDEAHEWAEENGYEITKTQDGKGDKACIAWMRRAAKLTDSNEHSNPEYRFAIKYRLAVQSENDEYYQYPPNMDYMEELQNAAITDWNESEMHQYAPDSLEVVSTVMSFDGIDCIITVETAHGLSDHEIGRLKEWITGQMSDGWGEGFEQREIATGRDTVEEWIEPEDEDEEGYYDSYDVRVDYFGQFWWTGSSDFRHPWAIELID